MEDSALLAPLLMALFLPKQRGTAKQTLNSATGIVVAASYDNVGHPNATPAMSDVYGHNQLQIAAPLQSRRLYLPLMRR